VSARDHWYRQFGGPDAYLYKIAMQLGMLLLS